ncbi:TetR/AcrR family transcriptional regulator [Actinocorallia longicatena]|uniref:HTH tetR-type domain-containing protein n=1 Tax=Actinocorallia longicatena TaxID=111803 RepID=A0ABP6QL78_9ACTN
MSSETPRPLPGLAERLPPPPGPELWPFLDAAGVCLARHGLSRTSMVDISREMGVSRSTVYRQLTSVENAAWLLLSKELHAFYDALPEIFATTTGPDVVLRPLAALLRGAWASPIIAKVMRDEPDFVGRAVSFHAGPMLDQGAEMLAPLYQSLMDSGGIRRQDPQVLAHWLLRTFMVLLLAPPPGDLDALLEGVLLPVLAPPS